MIKKPYRDGSVDLETGLALTPEGVRTFEHPYLAYAAEKTGIGICRAGRSVINVFAGWRGYPPMSKEDYMAELPNPGTLRKFGGVTLGAAVAFAAVVAGPELTEILPHAVGYIGGSVQERILDPLTRTGQI